MDDTRKTMPTREATSALWFALDRRFALATAAVSLLAGLVAFVNAWHVSMWVDEGYTIDIATRSLFDIWRMLQNIDVVHSLYNVLLHPWLTTLGVTEVSVRLPSTLAVVAATAGVMIVTRRLAGTAPALAAGCVFAVLPRVTWMGIEGRSYALTTAIAVWWTVLFVSLIRRPSLGKAVGYAALGALASSLNIFLVLLIGAHGVALLAERRVRFTRAFWIWLGAGAAAAAGGLPVLLTAMSQSAQIGPSRFGLVGYARSVLVNQWFLGGTPTVFLSGDGGSVGDGPGSQLWKPASVLLAALCWLLVTYAVLRRSPQEPVDDPPGFRAVFVSWLVVPSALLVGYALVGSPLYNPRYLTFCAPAVAALVGIALVGLSRDTALPRRLRSPWVAAVAGGLVVVLAAPVYASQRGVYAKQGADWLLVAEFVSERRGPDQAVYFAPRTPQTGAVVGITGRSAKSMYPDAFANLRDLTLVSTAAADADLLGRSQQLSASLDRLDGIQTVFALRRVDYAAPTVAEEEALLAGAGFRPDETWRGPLNTVTEYVRGP